MISESDKKLLRALEVQKLLGIPNAHNGPFPKTRRPAKHQGMCNVCEEYAAHILWKDIPSNSNTWITVLCDTCLSSVCEDCYDVDDEEGFIQCHNCHEMECMQS